MTRLLGSTILSGMLFLCFMTKVLLNPLVPGEDLEECCSDARDLWSMIWRE